MDVDDNGQDAIVYVVNSSFNKSNPENQDQLSTSYPVSLLSFVENVRRKKNFSSSPTFSMVCC